MISTGITGEQELIVTSEYTARSMGSGELEVLATPALAALIEKTAWMSIADCLEEGESTVGTLITLNHTSATPAGMKVSCRTEVTEVDRRRVVFRFEAFDEAGKIADGIHERFVIKSGRFMEKAASKKKQQ